MQAKADRLKFSGNEVKALKAKQKALEAEKKVVKTTEQVAKAQIRADKKNEEAIAFLSKIPERANRQISRAKSYSEKINKKINQDSGTNKGFKWMIPLVGVVFLLIVALGVVGGDKDNSPKDVISETFVESESNDAIVPTSRIEEYDLSLIKDKNLFEYPDKDLIAKKLTYVDGINKTIQTSSNIYIVISDLIEEGITNYDVIEKKTKYGGVIEFFDSFNDMLNRAYELDEEDSSDRIIYVENVLFILHQSISPSFIDSLISGIVAEIPAIDEETDVENNEEIIAAATATFVNSSDNESSINSISPQFNSIANSSVPNYSGGPYAVINNNVPSFTEGQKNNNQSFEHYSNLDSKGRSGVAFANISKELMPTGQRDSIGMIKPSGWKTVKYNNLIEGNYLYNRCHLIGWQLAGENANAKNLITGTRYLNVNGMLPFENKVSDYIRETNNHVLYRATPKFDGNNLVATGVQLEAWSVEDNGAGICFNVFCYNIQPGIVIDYATGDSHVGEAVASENTQTNINVTPASNNGNGSVSASSGNANGGGSASGGSNGSGDGSTSGGNSSNGGSPTANGNVNNTPQTPQSNASGAYIVNLNNNKIHKNGGCSRPPAEHNRKYFNTLEEAQAFTGGNDLCGNCW